VNGNRVGAKSTAPYNVLQYGDVSWKWEQSFHPESILAL